MSLNGSFVEDNRSEPGPAHDRLPLTAITNTVGNQQSLASKRLLGSNSEHNFDQKEDRADKYCPSQGAYEEFQKRLGSINEFKHRATPQLSRMNSPKSHAPSIASTNVPTRPQVYEEGPNPPRGEHWTGSQPMIPSQPGSAYTKAMSDLQRLISEKEREYITLKQEYDQLREEFSDPLQCDQVIDHFVHELRELTKQAHETAASNQALVIQREEIEYNIQKLRIKSSKLDQEIEKHEQIVEKSQIVLTKKDREISQITGTSIFEQPVSFDHPYKGNRNQQNSIPFCAYDFALVKDRKEQAAGLFNEARANYKAQETDARRKSSSENFAGGQPKGQGRHENSNNWENEQPAFCAIDLGKASFGGGLDYVPKKPSFQYGPAISGKVGLPQPAPAVIGQPVKPKPLLTGHSEDNYQEMYRLMSKKQTLRQEMAELAKSGDTHSPYYHLLCTNAEELDEMIQVLKEIVQRQNAEKYPPK